MLPLDFAGGPKAERRRRAEQLLARVGLSHRLGHRPARLSGGEQQRVAIARALANDPPIILADEPTGNLDRKTGEQILALLVELTAEAKTLVVVTHDEAIAERAHLVLRLEDGRVADLPASAAPPPRPVLTPAAEEDRR
jgi:predicted ABC-type transport system involved in lysophospholipase L1 biosynthesis ATPase subunit